MSRPRNCYPCPRSNCNPCRRSEPDLVLVRVYGEDITDTSLYELKFEIADVNAPIRKDIDRLGRIRDRMNKRLVNLRKKNSTDRQINRLKRDIREVEVKIKKLKVKLCS